MSNKFLFSWLATAILTVIILVACGGGVSTGIGRGSGMGGTGTRAVVEGNVAAVTVQFERSMSNRLFAGFVDIIVAPLKAQTGVPGIQVSGGDQTTTTDTVGSFSLVGVEHSEDFILIFALNNGQKISLQIGTVSAGALVRVSDIVLNTSQGTATPSNITKEDSPDNDSDAEDDESVESTDDTSADDNSDGTSDETTDD